METHELRPTAEKSGDSFQLERLLQAREKSIALMETLGKRILPGMTEGEALAICDSLYKERGVEKKWHRSWIRFGENTLLPYGELADPKTTLKENDIFFVDLGPVFDNYEGDIGKAYVVGNDSEMHKCKKDSEEIFQIVSDKWREDRLTGEALYQFAEEEAKKRGWLFSTRGASGHRVSDFPHAVHYKGAIAKLPFTPSRGIWVLEIQIRHPERPFGAFVEDLLL
jgi:Xaa-Pro aminopeptidase